MLDDSRLKVDREGLALRRWTRTLIGRYLQASDGWESVRYWLNYQGRALYFAEPVDMAEARADIRRDCEATVRCRRPSQDAIDGFLGERAALNPTSYGKGRVARRIMKDLATKQASDMSVSTVEYFTKVVTAVSARADRWDG